MISYKPGGPESKSSLSNTCGSAAVEFALILPVYLVLSLGTLAYGLYFGAAHSVQQLAADAARASVAGLNAAERQSLSKDYVAKNVSNYPLLRGSSVTVIAAASPTDAASYMVTVSYDARNLPLGNLPTFLPLPSTQIDRSAVILQGGEQ